MTKQIKILGTGCCCACGKLYDLVAQKAAELKADVVITKSNDMMEIVAAGVLSTPAILIDGKIVHAGGLPTESEIESWLK